MNVWNMTVVHAKTEAGDDRLQIMCGWAEEGEVNVLLPTFFFLGFARRGLDGCMIVSQCYCPSQRDEEEEDERVTTTCFCISSLSGHIFGCKVLFSCPISLGNMARIVRARVKDPY